jgi:tetratricopeptide (TPR) repeat protein
MKNQDIVNEQKERAFIFMEEDKYDEAIEEFNNAIRLNPEDAESHFRRGECYFFKNDFDKAITDYSRAINLDPDSAQAYCFR